MACPSSLAREWEYYNWASAAGIEGLASGPEANRGVNLHRILSVVPFAGREHGDLPFALRERVESEVARLGQAVNSYETWLCSRFLERRNEFVEWVIDQHPDGRDAVDQVEVLLDDTRLGQYFTGTPDVIVIAAGNGKSVGGVVDYKTGQGQHKEAAENTQLAINARLVQQRVGDLPSPDIVYTVVLTEPEVSEPLQIGKYDRRALEKIGEKMTKAEKTSLPLAAAVQRIAGTSDLPKSLDAQLDSSASIGSHCLRCKGKVCCGAMKIAASEAAWKMYSIIEYAQKNPINPAMDTKKLSDSIALSSSLESLQKIISSYREEAENLALQLNAKGVTLSDVVIEEGSKRIALEESDARALHAKLAPVLGVATSKAITFEQFAAGIAEGSKISATGLRAFLAGALGLPEPKVVEKLGSMMAAMGQTSPLIQKPTSPTIKTTRDTSEVLDHLSMQTRAAIAEASGASRNEVTPTKLSVELEQSMASIPAAAPATTKPKKGLPKAPKPVESAPSIETEVRKPQGVALWG